MRKLVRFFGRPAVAAWLLLLTLGMAALGSFFPQRPAEGPAALARWEGAVRARYGPLTDLLGALGLFRWYTSPLFLLALALPVVATVLCTLQRWPALRRPLLRRSAPHWGTLMTHLSVPLFLLALAMSGLGWQEELTLSPGESGTLRPEGRILRCDGVSVERYADGSVADYRVEMTVQVDGGEIRRGTVRLNAPLTMGGVGVFLSGYAVREGRPVVTLLAVSDPGYIPFLVAGGLLLLGLSLTVLAPPAGPPPGPPSSR